MKPADRETSNVSWWWSMPTVRFQSQTDRTIKHVVCNKESILQRLSGTPGWIWHFACCMSVLTAKSRAAAELRSRNRELRSRNRELRGQGRHILPDTRCHSRSRCNIPHGVGARAVHILPGSLSSAGSAVKPGWVDMWGWVDMNSEYTFSHCESASVHLRSADCIGVVSWDTTPAKVPSYRHSAPL